MDDEINCPICGDELYYVEKVADGLVYEARFCEMCQRYFDWDTLKEIIWISGQFKVKEDV